MRPNTTLCTTTQALVVIALIGILISTPHSVHPGADHGIGRNSAVPSMSSPASFLDQPLHSRTGLLPIAVTSPQATSSTPAANYDEQLGTTFTQSFASLAYNVTAVAQSDKYGYGPAYLLNGLGNTGSAGYWYQVGLSYHWPFSQGGYNPGFAMNYEVFSPQGASVFPPSGGGGLTSIQVNSGDTVLLSLTFSAGEVVMMAKDWNTQSSRSVSFSAERATSFKGLTNNFEQNGFFTGLMTEWYHVDIYLANEGEVTYSGNSASLSSAWMWMDEFSVAGAGLVFSDATATPITLSSSPSQLQPFYSHGTYEAVDSYEFVTGFQPPPVQVSRPIATPVSVDTGQPASFICNAAGGIPPFTYGWTFGDGSVATGQNVSHIFNSPGSMNVQCTATDSLQTSSQNATSIMVLSDPTIILQTVNPSSVDIGQTVTFTVQATGGSGVYTYRWMDLPTACSSSNVSTLSCQPTATGTFQTTANITDSNGVSVKSGALSVTVYPDPSLTSFTSSPNKLDIGQTITFVASATSGSGGLSLTYYSLPTGCDTSNSTNLSCTPTATGTYHVILTVTDSNGFTISSNRITIVVNPDPNATLIASPSSIDIGQTLTLTVTAHGGTGIFSYSYPVLPSRCTSSNSPSIPCTPSTIGNYTIEAVVADQAGEIFTANTSVTVNPVIGISTFTTSLARVDAGQEFTLTLSTTGGTAPLSYSYSGLPPNCQSINSPVLHCTPSISGPYLIQVTVTDQAGKTATSSMNVSVQQTRANGLTSNQELLLVVGVITAFISAIIGAALLMRGRKDSSESETRKT